MITQESTDALRIGRVQVGSMCGGSYGPVFSKPRVSKERKFIIFDGLGIGFWLKESRQSGEKISPIKAVLAVAGWLGDNRALRKERYQ